MNTGTLAVALIFGFPFLIVAGFFLVWALKIITGGAGRNAAQLREEETKLIQELHQGLLRMEQRIDSLETILLDTSRKEEPRDE
jgi:phage shock protein B